MVYPTETSMTEYNEIQQQTVGKTEIKYTRPKFVHRVLANLIDFLIFGVLFVTLFIATRNIVGSTKGYRTAFDSMIQMRLESGLFVEGDKEGEVVDIITYLNNHTQYTPQSIVYNCEKAVDKFFAFEEPLLSAEKYQKIVEQYDELRLKATTTFQGEIVHLWYKNDEDKVVKNDNYETSATIKMAISNWYKGYFDTYLQGYLSTTPKYYDVTKTVSNYLIFVEIPVAFVVALIFTYYIPTVFFTHGRQTLGKALYHVGTVDSRFLSPTFARNLAKFGIFLVEMIAGVVTLGIIFIVSTTMMAFTKNRQSFPEYMLGLQEVDTSRNKIYVSMTEAILENAKTNKRPNDFKLIDMP